jgi:hypothetical protein
VQNYGGCKGDLYLIHNFGVKLPQSGGILTLYKPQCCITITGGSAGWGHPAWGQQLKPER